MKIKVTQDHIDFNKSPYVKHSPIKQALIDAGFYNIIVHTNRFSLGNVTIGLPPRVKTFMRNFDAGSTVQPFEFEFDYKNPMNLWDRIKASFL